MFELLLAVIPFCIGWFISNRQNRKIINNLETSKKLLCEELNRNSPQRKFSIENDEKGNPQKVVSINIEMVSATSMNAEGLAPDVTTGETND